MENIKFKVVNEDGTSMDNFPKNPLEEKWSMLYPAIPKPENSQVCDDYSCTACARCPRGSNWQVPDEDLEVWNRYKKKIEEYNKIHNPSMYKKPEKVKEKVMI